jgi:hypothetical protein
MTLRTQRIAILLMLAVFAYSGAYLLFRTLHMHRADNGNSLVFIIPESQRAFSYVFAPLIYLDGAATGIRCQIVP